MKYAVHPHRALLVLAAAAIAVASVAWGAESRPAVHKTKPVVKTTAKSTTLSATAKRLAHKNAVANVAVARHTAPAPQPASVAGAQGMRIFRDPQTGEIGPPSPEAIAAINADTPPEDTSNLQQVQLPDGSWMMDLKGHFQDFAVIQLDANGRRTMGCTTDVKKTLSQGPVAAPQREEK